MKTRARPPVLIVAGPLPPPLHGVTISTSLILNSDRVRSAFRVCHLDTSDHRDFATIGNWDTRNVTLGALNLLRLVPMLIRHRNGVFYLPISQTSGGFMRDSLFIHAARLAGWPVAAHLRGSEFSTHFYPEQRWLMRRWIRWTLGRISSIGVLGESLRTVFAELVEPARIVVVPNGTPDVRPGASGQRDHSHVLFLSNLRRRKGVVEAIDAAIRASERVPSARFTFVGDPDEPGILSELEARVASARAPVTIMPGIDGAEKARLLSSAGILLFPPVLPEGQPRVVLEAMAAGMAIVTTARGAIPETVRDGVDGFVLGEPDPAQLGDCLVRLLSDTDLQRKMGASARRRYVDEFTQERADERLVAWLGRVGTNGSHP